MHKIYGGTIMAEMGLGYGSEFQLLRFLGHHRHELERLILRDTNINSELDYDMDWLDFPKNNKRNSLDGEHTGIEFLDDNLKKEISGKWKAYWPQTGNAPNWDAIIYCSPIVPDANLKDKWVIVEAKANLEELETDSGAGDVSKNIIDKAFDSTKQRFEIVSQNNWFEKYYQLANRLAFINFMLENGIETSLLNIYFINGYVKRDFATNEILEDKSVKNIFEWRKKIDEEYAYLGINDNAKKYISEIFVDCM
jgi:hypothetical protein